MNERMLKPYGWTKCFLLSAFNVSFLTIAILLFMNENSIYSQVIEYETSEWSSPPIMDIISSNTSSCPEGYQ